MTKGLVALALAAALATAALLPGDTRPTRQGADAGFTYGYLPSVVAHHDLDFSDDAFPFDSSMPHTVRGRTHNAFPIGPAVWWSPGFLAADAVGAAARVAAGSSRPAPDGRSWPYDALVGLIALALGVIGLWATYAAAANFASRAASGLATAAVWLAGPVVYYTQVNVMQGHAAAFCAAALLVLAWLRARERPDSSLWRVAALGLLGGLVALTRWEDGLLLLGPAVDALAGTLRGRRAPDVVATAVLGAAALAAFLPQMVVWNALYGSPFRPPRGEASGAFLNPHRLHLADVLVSWRHGMLSWHPVLAVGVIGLVLLLRRHRRVALPLIVVAVLVTVLNAAVLDWWAGVSFGARRFDGMWPVLALGVAVVADRVPRLVALAVTAALAVVNLTLLIAFDAHLVSGDGPVRPSALWHALGRVPILPALTTWSGLKTFWVAGLLVLALAAGLWRRVRLRPASRFAPAAVAGLMASLLVSGVVAAAAAAHPGRYDAHVFEAGYFVPQATRPARADRVIRPGDDVWTLIWAFPGFLPPGCYEATPTGVTGPGKLVVRVDRRAVADGTGTGRPFRTRTGFIRLDFRVSGGPVHVDAVRVDRARGRRC